MKRSLFHLAVMALAVACVFAWGGLSSAHAEYTGPRLRFRLAHPCPPGHHTTLAFEMFGDIVARKSGNKIKVHVFPNAVLGSDVVMIKGAQSGGLEMAVSSSPNLTRFVPSLMVFDLPYITSPEYQKNLYASVDHGELRTYFQKKFNEVGLEPIMFCEYGYRDFFSVKKPIRSVEDLAGIVVRTTASPVETEVAKALGMRPKTLAWGETHTALREGIVEGEGNTFSFLLNAEHEDLLKYGFISRHNYGMQILSANRQWWERLDPQARRIIREAADEALKYQREVLAPQSEEQARRRFEQDGIVVVQPTDAMMDEMRRKTRPVWDIFRRSVTQELIDLVAETQHDRR